MAPSQMKETAKPNVQTLAGKTIAGRIEKKPPAFFVTLAIRNKNESFENALNDHVKQESLVTNPPSATQTAVSLSRDEEDSPFNLDDAIPRAGLRFPGEKKGKRPILGRWSAENRVVEALRADMKVIHKRHVQGIISPIFHQAAKMAENGYMWDLAGREDVTEEEGTEIWKRFLGKLWADSTRRWPRKLSQYQFTKFFSALAEARWAEIHEPKNDGQEPGLLVKHISMFLDAAEMAGFPWANGGGVFSDEDEDYDDDVEE